MNSSESQPNLLRANGARFLWLYLLFAAAWASGTVIADWLYPWRYYDELLIFLLPPILFATQYYPRRVFYTGSLIAYAAAFISDYMVIDRSTETLITITFIITAILIAQELIFRSSRKLRNVLSENQKLANQLSISLDKIKKISESLPMCQMCNKLRTDEDIWKEFEACLQQELNTELVYGVCESCLGDIMENFNEMQDEHSEPIPPFDKTKAT